MLRFLEAINPWNTYFTATNFEDALIDIQVILNTIDNAESPPLSHQEKDKQLERAYNLALLCLNAADKRKPDKQLSFFLADIFRQYAALCFAENYFGAKQILTLSLNLHLYTIGINNECIDVHDFATLEDLKKQCEARPLIFHAMEESILSTSIDHCMTLAYMSSFVQPFPKKRLYSLAETVRWLGNSYQQIDQYKKINKENELRFSQLFDLSEALHLFNDNDESKKALADLYFQAWPFRHIRKNPEDISGTCKIYDKALAYDVSPEMQARVAAKRFSILFSNGQQSEAVPLIQKAFLIAQNLNDSEEKQILLADLNDSYAACLMDPTILDLDEAEAYMAKAAQYAASCRANGNDHLQFALYDMRYAELKLVMDDLDGAKETIKRALNTIQKQPYCQEPHIYRAEALKSLIHKVSNVI